MLHDWDIHQARWLNLFCSLCYIATQFYYVTLPVYSSPVIQRMVNRKWLISPLYKYHSMLHILLARNVIENHSYVKRVFLPRLALQLIPKCTPARLNNVD